MAGTFIEIKVEDKPVLDALNRLLAAAGDLTPAFEDIGEHLQLAHEERFRREVSPDGIPWAPLSPVTLARKPKNKDKILVLNDELRGTLRYQASATELLFGTDRPYGAAHQFGMPKGYAGTGSYKTRKGTFPIPWGDIPARPFLGLSDEDERTILDILNDHLATAVR